MGPRLRVGPRGAPPTRVPPYHRIRSRRSEERSPRIRHAGRGHERFRPRDRSARRSAHAATFLPRRRRRVPIRRLRRHDGALRPRRPRRERSAHRRQSGRATGAADRDVDADLQPAGEDHRPGGKHAARQRTPQRVRDLRRPLARHLERFTQYRAARVPGDRPVRARRRPRLRRSGAAPGPRARDGRARGRLRPPTHPRRGDGGVRARRGGGRARVRRAAIVRRTSTCGPVACSWRWTTPTSGR